MSSAVTDDTRQRYAVSALIGECESLLENAGRPGGLNESQEKSPLRLLVAQVLAAFRMPSKPERALVEPGNILAFSQPNRKGP